MKRYGTCRISKCTVTNVTKYVRINQIIVNWVGNYFQSHYSNALITDLRRISQSAVVPDNVRVTVHFVSRVDPTAKLLSGTPALTRLRVTANQNKTREYLARFRRDGPHSQCGRRATGRYFLARCYPGLWRASSTPRGYTAGSWIVCAKVPPPQNSFLVNSKVSRISSLPPFLLFFFVQRRTSTVSSALYSSHLYERANERGGAPSYKPDVRQLTEKWIIRFALTLLGSQAFVIIVDKSFPSAISESVFLQILLNIPTNSNERSSVIS